MESTIQWNNQSSATSIKDAIADMKLGKDIGWMGTNALMPKSDDFHHWMHFAHLLTVIYNRDCSPKKFSIIRIGKLLEISRLGGGGRVVCPCDGDFYYRNISYYKSCKIVVQNIYI